MKKIPNVLLFGFALMLGISTAGFAAKGGKVPIVYVPQDEITVVAAQKGWLQEEYAKYGSKTELVDPGTIRQLGVEASLLDRGDLHFATRMQYPALCHKASGLDAVVVWQSGKVNRSFTPILVLKDSPLTSITQLKGKKFGSGRIGCGWSGPFETFLTKGIKLDDSGKGEVKYLNILATAAQQQAFLAGRIDATSTHPPVAQFTSLILQGLTKTIDMPPENGVYVNFAGRTSYFCMREFADEHPELVKAFLVVRERTVQWIRANPDAAATIIARELRLPQPVAKFGIVDISNYRFIPGEPSWDEAVNSIKQFQDWYVKSGDTLLAKFQLSDAELRTFVDKRFFKGGQYSIYQ